MKAIQGHQQGFQHKLQTIVQMKMAWQSADECIPVEEYAYVFHFALLEDQIRISLHPLPKLSVHVKIILYRGQPGHSDFFHYEFFYLSHQYVLLITTLPVSEYLQLHHQ